MLWSLGVFNSQKPIWNIIIIYRMQLLMILRIFSLGSPLAFSKFPRTGAFSKFPRTGAIIFSTFSTLSSTTSSSSCLSSTANPFLAQGATPLFSKLQPSFLPSAVTTSLEFLKSRFSEIESSAEKGSIDARNILPEVSKRVVSERVASGRLVRKRSGGGHRQN